jgi:predicted NBD/HSP70 family sugar kinase
MGVSLTEAVLVEASDGDALVIGELDTLRSWRQFDFAAQLSLRFGAPSWVRGAAQMMTVGELKAGAGQGFADMLFLKLDHSIGAGVAAGGRVQQGAQGVAGMVGHAPTGEDCDVACHCGARGCLDAVASGNAIARQAARAAQDGRSRYLAEMIERNGEIGAADVSHGAQLGEAFCAEILARCGRLVGQSVAPMVNLLNPAVVVLGGAVAQSGDILLAAVREAVYRQSHPLVTRDLRIVRSQMGDSAGLVGAAQMVCDEMFAPAMIREWIALGSPRHSPTFLAYLQTEKARARAASRGQTRIRALPALQGGSY